MADEGTVKWWLAQITERQKALEKSWLTDAQKVVRIFDAGDDPDKIPFNILYSNTETVLPTLFNSVPRPDVSRRYTQTDPKRRQIDAAVQQATERQLEYYIDSNQGEYDDFDEAVVQVVTAGLVPGLGQIRNKIHQEGGFQRICPELVQYDRFVWSYARTWSKVRWVAFGHDLTKDDFKRQFKEFAAKDEFKEFDWKKLSEPDEEASEDQRKGRQGTMLVWEIEDAFTKEIKFVCDSFPESFLHEEPYPVDLTSRFSCPRPLVFKRKLGELLPVPLYRLYQKQAEELNNITRRINGVIKVCKVRGIYNKLLGDLEAALNVAEGTFVASDQAQALAQDGGLDKHIWVMPVEKIVPILVQLYEAQRNCKQTIYEIMGISDIQRGASQASETAKAQEIKNSWGTLRVKRSQRMVSVFCRDVLRIAAEQAAGIFTPATWRSVTQLPYLLNVEREGLMEQAKTPQGMQLQQAAQAGDQTAAQQIQFYSYLMSLPTWEEIIQVMKDRFQRSFRIDIETNSTVDLEATEDKVAIGEFMNAFGQMTSGLTPLVEAGVLPFPAAKAILSETFRKFRFGRRVQDALDAMQPPQPKPDAEAVQQQHKAEMATKDASHAAEKEQWQQTVTALKAQVAQLQVEKATDGHQSKVREGELKADSRGKMMLQEQKVSMKEQQLQEKELEMNIQQAQQAIAQMVKEAQQAIQQTVQQALQQVTQTVQEGMHANELSQTKAETQDTALSNAVAGLQKSQEAILAAVEALTKTAGAPRERTLMVDEKTGAKRVIDKVLN